MLVREFDFELGFAVVLDELVRVAAGVKADEGRTRAGELLCVWFSC